MFISELGDLSTDPAFQMQNFWVSILSPMDLRWVHQFGKFLAPTLQEDFPPSNGVGKIFIVQQQVGQTSSLKVWVCILDFLFYFFVYKSGKEVGVVRNIVADLQPSSSKLALTPPLALFYPPCVTPWVVSINP